MGDHCADRSTAAGKKGRETGRKPSESMEKLEELYRDIPNGFENLTFANFGGSGSKDQTAKSSAALKPESTKEDLDAIYQRILGDFQEELTFKNFGTEVMGQIRGNDRSSPATLSGSLDFSKALQAVQPIRSRQTIENKTETDYIVKSPRPSNGPIDIEKNGITLNGGLSGNPMSMEGGRRSRRREPNASIDGLSMMSMAAAQKAGIRKRQGIPHSNICCFCNRYVFVFRHRCLVCGRVYCRECVVFGMGDMKEGRKCTPCVGHRFSQRYIDRAGQMGCLGLPNSVKTAELKWAELGPRKPRRGTSTPLQARTLIPGSPLTGAQSLSLNSVQPTTIGPRPIT